MIKNHQISASSWVLNFHIYYINQMSFITLICDLLSIENIFYWYNMMDKTGSSTYGNKCLDRKTWIFRNSCIALSLGKLLSLSEPFFYLWNWGSPELHLLRSCHVPLLSVLWFWIWFILCIYCVIGSYSAHTEFSIMPDAGMAFINYFAVLPIVKL